MTIEEAVLVLKRYQGYEPMEYGNILKHSFDLTDETVDTLLSAIRTETAGEPLTLEQLQHMDEQRELARRMREMAVNTGGLNCLGCGYEHTCGVHGCVVLKRAADLLDPAVDITTPIPLDRLRELEEADRDGRLVMLDEPRKPLIWGDDNHDSILCPNCKHDLMGGFQEADSCEVPMYQCPYCGQPIDGTQALTHEEAETALKGENHEANPV